MSSLKQLKQGLDMYSIATGNSAVDLEVEVNELMNAGWRPVGGLAVEPHWYIEEGTT